MHVKTAKGWWRVGLLRSQNTHSSVLPKQCDLRKSLSFAASTSSSINRPDNGTDFMEAIVNDERDNVHGGTL